jgi:hypothetical protein
MLFRQQNKPFGGNGPVVRRPFSKTMFGGNGPVVKKAFSICM